MKLVEWDKEYEISTEGQRGVKCIKLLCEHIGYEEEYGRNPLESFLGDNPGAIKAIREWIYEQNNESWKEELITSLPEE